MEKKKKKKKLASENEERSSPVLGEQREADQEKTPFRYSIEPLISTDEHYYRLVPVKCPALPGSMIFVVCPLATRLCRP